MSRKNVYSLVLDLMESKTDEEKIKAFNRFFKEREEKIELLSVDDINGKRKHKKIYYKNELPSVFTRLNDEEKEIINDLFVIAYEKKNTELTKKHKDVLRNIFRINKKSDIKNIIDYYFFCHNFLNLNLEIVNSDLTNYKDYYLPLTISFDKRKELNHKGIVKINQIRPGMITELDLYFINKYVLEMDRYVINDKLIYSKYSILEKEYRDIIKAYFKYQSFITASQVLGKSVTMTRVMFYTAIKAVVNFLETPEGVTAFRLMFSSPKSVINKNDIKNMFSEFGDFIIYIFEEEFIKNIKYDAEKECFIAL